MSDLGELEELIAYLVRTSRLSAAEATRLVNEVLGFLAETPEAFIRRRHLALQSQGLANDAIFAQLAGRARAVALPRAAAHAAPDPPNHLRLNGDSRNVWNRRLHRPARRGADPDARTASARVSRLRLRGYRRRAQRQAARPQEQGQGPRAREPLAREAARRPRHRAHALGDARRAERSQRASAQRRGEPLRDRPQRHHRERGRAARAPRSAGRRVPVGDRFRSARASHRRHAGGRSSRIACARRCVS